MDRSRMSMPDRIWANEESYGKWAHDPIWSMMSAEYVRVDLVAEKDAEIERLRKALEQAVDAGSLTLNLEFKGYIGHGMWRYKKEEAGRYIVAQSNTEYFFGGYVEDNPELAAYLHEREENQDETQS